MTGFLERACAEARARVAEASRLVPLELLRAPTASAPPSLAVALAVPGTAVIAEIKRASPSKGHLAWVPDPAAQRGRVRRRWRRAISVLTEPRTSTGPSATSPQVAAAVDVPVIRKDFLVDPYQVWEARRAGAAAVLLIVAALDDDALVRLLETTAEAGLDALVEVHDPDEAARAGRAYAAAATRTAARGRGERPRPRHPAGGPGRFAACVDALPDGAIAVAESGVAGPDDVRRAAAAGADAVLVGEHVVTAPDPKQRCEPRRAGCAAPADRI
jgi:indole-3-glycerol phosphate synthase